MVKETVLKRIAVDGLVALAKSVGSESGKKIVGKDRTTNKKGEVLQNINTSVSMVVKDYDWDVIDTNMCRVAQYAKELIPIAGATMASYIILPALAGAVVAPAGAGATITVYTLTNVSVLTCGTWKMLQSLSDN